MPILAEARLISEDIPVERSDKTGTAKLFELRGSGRGASYFAAELIKTFGVEKSA